MRRSTGVRFVAKVALVSGLAAMSAWPSSAGAAHADSSAKTVAETVSCPTAKKALQLYAFAYRPSLGYAAALISTGPAGTPATTELVGAQTDKSNYVVSSACDRTKVSVRFTHRRLRSAGVIKAGYYQWPTVYCGAPRRVFVRYRISFDASGKPVSATMTAWARSKKSRLREIGYVQWSRNRSVTYYSPKSCVSQ